MTNYRPLIYVDHKQNNPKYCHNLDVKFQVSSHSIIHPKIEKNANNLHRKAFCDQLPPAYVVGRDVMFSQVSVCPQGGTPGPVPGPVWGGGGDPIALLLVLSQVLF